MSLWHKRKRVVSIAILIDGLLTLWYWMPIFPVRPVFNVWINYEQHLVSTSCRLSKQDIDSLTSILKRDNQIFFVGKSMIFVTPKLLFDKELIWNYTSKAGIAFPDSNYALDYEYNIWRRK